MLLSYFVVLFLIILFLILIRSYSNALAWMLITFLNLFSLGLGYAPDLLLSKLQIYPPVQNFQWQEKNLIVLLGSGHEKWGPEQNILPKPHGLTRMYEAFKQYQNCKKQNVTCHILASGGDPSKIGQSEAATYKKHLVYLGVIAEDVFTEDKSRNTIENAEFSSPLIIEGDYSFKILVTSGFHMTRALYSFQQNKIFDLQPSPADNLQASFVKYPNALNLYLVNLSLHEVAGILKAYLKVHKPALYQKLAEWI